jgi:dienelactone hydrolase
MRPVLALALLLSIACSSGGDADTGSSGGGPSTGVTPTTGDAATTTASSTTGEDPTTTGPASTTGGPDPVTTGGPTGDTGDASSGEPATTGDASSTGAPVDPNVDVDPSMGMGGAIAPGSLGVTPLGAEIWVPAAYDPQKLASPVIWLFNETIDQWSAATAADAAILVDLKEYNDTQKIVAKLNETIELLETQYNVDRGRFYWAGWSAGGNLVIIIGSQNQDTLAGTMVFPGTGGNIAQPDLAAWQGHKIRMYYACGSDDPNFDANAVEFEANAWKEQYGYTTRFDLVPGGPHYLDENTYKVREAAWAWMRGFNLKN